MNKLNKFFKREARNYVNENAATIKYETFMKMACSPSAHLYHNHIA